MIVVLALCVSLFAAPVFAQQTYLAPYEGAGVEGDPFRPVGMASGVECKSVRSDETKSLGYAVCAGPTLPADARVISLTGKRSITGADRANVLSLLSKPMSATTSDGLLSELVDSEHVAIKRINGRQRIILKNAEVWSRPSPLASYWTDAKRWLAAAFFLPKTIPSYLVATAVAWAASPVIETWTCADDSTPTYFCDHAWVRTGGSTAEIVSNTLRNVNSVGTNTFYADTDLDSTDMRGFVTLVDIDRGTATNVAGGMIIRHTGTATATYVYCVARHAASSEIERGHVVSGSLTTDATVSATVADGDVIEARAVDDQVSCYHNAALVLGPSTETTGDGNLNAGVRFSGSGTATTTSVVMDNWQATNTIPSGSFGVLRRRL